MNAIPFDTANPLPAVVADYITNVMPKMHGWCFPAKADALTRAALTTNPCTILEIGVWGGHSMILLALTCQHLERGIVLGIDPWSAPDSVDGFPPTDDNAKWWGGVDHDKVYESCIAQARHLKVMNRTIFIRSTSEMFAPFCPFVDLLHIDGNHSEPHSVHDVTHYVPRVRPGGIICFDDTNWECTKAAQKFLLLSCDLLGYVEQPGQQCGFYRKRIDAPTTTKTQ